VETAVEGLVLAAVVSGLAAAGETARGSLGIEEADGVGVGLFALDRLDGMVGGCLVVSRVNTTLVAGLSTFNGRI